MDKHIKILFKLYKRVNDRRGLNWSNINIITYIKLHLKK